MASIKQFCIGWSSVVMGVAIAAFPTATQAQSIVPDNTLGSTVSPLVNNTYTIGGGLTSGDNLFHSFSEFGLPNGEIADFTSGAGVLNIISRVTGGNVSTINGTLSAGDVNLFIINPNGLTFADQATLDIGRSFIGSTAGSLLFEDGTQLETGADTDFNGTASMPVTFEIADGGGPINVMDTGVNGFVDDDDPGLQVSPENTLALIGGDITLEGGILQAPKGNLHLAALSAGESSILEFSSTTGTFTVKGASSEDIPANADSVLSLSDSILTADLAVQDTTGLTSLINLQGSSIILDNDTAVQSSVLSGGVGEPGRVRLITGIEGTVSLDNGSIVFSNIEPGGTFDGNDVGAIIISTGTLVMDNNAQLQSLVREATNGLNAGVGEPGNIIIFAAQGVELRGQRDATGKVTGIGTVLLGEGTGRTLAGTGGNLLEALNDSNRVGDLFGTILIVTPGDVILSDQVLISSTTSASDGNAGAVAIEANNVILFDEAEISSSTENAGDAGTVFLDISGDIVVNDSASIKTITEGDGDGGSILLGASNIFVENGGTISSAALDDATGSAGLIWAIAENDIVVRGQGSSINSLVDAANSIGNASASDQRGAIILSAERVGALNGGEITVDNRSSGEAGVLLIGADLVALNRGGQISAEASGNSTEGGDILIVGNSESNAFFTVLANQSNISTSTDSGVGGDIFINVFPEIIAAPSRDSNILTVSPGSNLGASIDITPGSPFLRNIEVAASDSVVSNDISAASAIGADGTVNGGSLENSLLQDPLLLPVDLVDPSRLIAQGCAAGDLQAAQNIGDLTLTGRDGLSATPEEQLSSSASTSTLATLANDADLAQSDAWAAANRRQPPEQTIAQGTENDVSDINDTTEAQTWRYGSDGQVVLMAQATPVPSSSVFPGFSCDVF